MAPSRPPRAGRGPRSPRGSSLWTEPGRSTRTIRPASPARRAGTGSGVETSACQVPSVRSTIAKTSRSDRSPATTAVMPCGPTCRAWKSTTSCLVRAEIVVAVPAEGLEARSCSSKKVATNSRAARCGASARSCSISANRVRRMRSTSDCGNTGSARASRSSSRASSKRRFGTSRSTPRPASLTDAPSAIPLRSNSSANSSGVCSAVPSSSRRAIIVATPSTSRGSADSGSGNAVRTETTYWPGMS